MKRWATLFGILLILSGCEGNNSEYDQPDDNNPPDNDLPSTLVLNLAELDQDTLLLEWNRPNGLEGEVNYKIYCGWIMLYELSRDQEVISLRVSPIPRLGDIRVEATQGDNRFILSPTSDLPVIDQ